MGITIIKKEIKKSITVEKDKKIVKDEQGTELMSEGVAPEHLCNVGLSSGFTHNLGNYSNVKAQVSFFKPCHEDDVDIAFAEVQDWVTERLNSIHTDYVQE